MSDSFLLDLQSDTEELLGFNPEADANQLLPPMPAGEYHVRFKFTNPNEDFADVDSKPANKRWATKIWGKQAQKVLVTSLTMELYNTEGGTFDGYTVRDGLVSTMLQTQTGTNRMQGVIQCIKGEFPPTVRTRPQFMVELTETIGEDGGATGIIAIDWEAAETTTEEEREELKKAGRKPFRVRGMKNFPQAKDGDGNVIPGVYVPEVSHNGETYRAYPFVARYITATGEGQEEQVEEQAPVVAPQATRAAQAPRAAAPQAPRAPQATATAPQSSAPPVPANATTRAPQGPRNSAPRAPR